jgi:5-methylcytosine-specific restriction enzyme subunit McrC
MSKGKDTVTYEFGTLYIEGQAHKEGETALSKNTFDNLWDFILSSKSTNDSDVVMSVHTRGGRRYIKTGRYVGTIQTKNGDVIEILPKIYKVSDQQETDEKVCRRVFLNMLRHFTDTRVRSFQDASLSAESNFPILEVYINNYISAIEQIIVGGLKKNYALVEENQNFLKGKLNIKKQITQNATNKAKFAITYSKYIEDIPQNRVIVTTLRKLFNDSRNSTNKAHITALLSIMSDVPSSQNIERDLKIASSSNRLFSAYDLVLKWSSQFLLNRGFTTFSGDIVNQSLLFQAERIFEDFIAFLFRKYAPSCYTTEAQNRRYFLVDKHNGRGMFKLRPDIVVEKDKTDFDYDNIIIDTKWKSLDSSKPNKNYLIDIKDMYQLYAYGHKYRHGHQIETGIDVIPKLVLIYPYSKNFTSNLPDFVYDEIKEDLGLKLMVVPFNLAEPKTYEKQVHDIIRSVSVKTDKQPIYINNWKADTVVMMAAEDSDSHEFITLVGCYKDDEHLKWIHKNMLYNIRIGNRRGAVNSSGKIAAASRLVLYNYSNPQEYKTYELSTSQHIIADYELMKEKEYPNARPGNKYVLYMIREEMALQPFYDIDDLKKRHAPSDLVDGAPFFFTVK